MRKSSQPKWPGNEPILQPARRIEINEVHGPVPEVTPEDVEVVAVIKRANLKVDG
jgi:hypothetical protein